MRLALQGDSTQRDLWSPAAWLKRRVGPHEKTSEKSAMSRAEEVENAYHKGAYAKENCRTTFKCEIKNDKIYRNDQGPRLTEHATTCVLEQKKRATGHNAS